jgi:integrase
MRPRNVWQAWDVARKLAGVPDFRFHDLRHSAATEMLRAGVDSRIVATVLGHRSMNMMRRYAHVAPELVVDAARKAHSKGS